MEYKVGDRVRVKSIDWYNKNKNIHGDIRFDNSVFVGGQSLYCGCELTICLVTYDSYYVIENDYYWTDEMIEGLVEEKSKYGTASYAVKPKSNANCLTRERADELATKIDKELPSENQNVWELPDGYQFVDEDGNVINAKKIALEKKKTKYPKTYEECCKILNTDDDSIIDISVPLHYNHLLISFTQLLICRDAYWQLYGEEMKLGKPWSPRWYDGYQKKYCIYNDGGNIQKGSWHFANTILVFPTEELLDTFKENFDPDIEICKEFL